MKKELKDSSYNLLGFRVNYEIDTDLQAYLSVIDSYLEHRGWKVVKSSAGVHTNSKNKHFHIHIVSQVDTALKIYKTGERYPFNIYIKENNLKIGQYSIKSEGPKLEEGDTDLHSAIERFLRYPLKEGVALHSHCINIDTDSLMQTAQAQYKLVLEAQHKDEVKQQQDKLKWNQIVKHLDDKKPTTYEEVFSELIEYTREDNPPVTIKVLNTKSINYMKLRKLLTNLQLIEVENYGTRILLKKDKPARAPPLTEYDLSDCSNEQIKLMKMALSGNYNL